jgi:hypothetical protein
VWTSAYIGTDCGDGSGALRSRQPPSLAACGAGEKAGDTSAAQPSGAAKPSVPADAGQSDWKPAIETASLPEKPCDLLPVAEVEALLKVARSVSI